MHWLPGPWTNGCQGSEEGSRTRPLRPISLSPAGGAVGETYRLHHWTVFLRGGNGLKLLGFFSDIYVCTGWFETSCGNPRAVSMMQTNVTGVSVGSTKDLTRYYCPQPLCDLVDRGSQMRRVA